MLRAHREGKVTVGTYIVQPPDQARTLVFDIDEGTEMEQDATLSDVVGVLADMNGLVWGVEASGRKGYHVWVVADDYMPAALLYQLGRGIREEAGHPSMEVFPKQTEVRDLGNLVKLPGGVHRVTGNPNNMLHVGHADVMRQPNTVALLTELAGQYPEVGVRTRRGDAPDTVEYPCVHSIQDGVQEGGRNTHLFHLATMLRRWSINDDNLEAILRRANDACPEPLDDTELAGVIENSQHSGPICGQLSDSVHCGDQCIMARHQGLYTRPGAMKWAAVGENVVLEVKSRTEDGQSVELAHEDIVQARAILKEASHGKVKQNG